MAKNRPEIMCPIRNMASLEACKDYADAVYFSVSDLSLRSNANNLKLSGLDNFTKKCHKYNIKTYLTVNSVIYNKDIKKAEKIIKKAKECRVDAVIVWDPAVIEIARKEKIQFIISTQANVSNWKSAEFYKKQGAKKIVVAREMTLKQIKELKKKVNIEVEAFVHGAMCVSISGRCLISSYMYGKSSNRGSCAQPCRKSWTLTDNENNKIIAEDSYFMNAKDICMIEHIPELIKAGIDSFKIEGRKRDPRYIATTARCYREAVDAYFNKTYTKEKVKTWIKELKEVYNRGFCTGFYFGDPKKDGISYNKSDNISNTKKIQIGIVTNYYAKIRVATIRFTHRGTRTDQHIIIEGKTTYFEQDIDSMQIDKEFVKTIKKGEEAAIKVKSRVRTNDCVYIILKKNKNI